MSPSLLYFHNEVPCFEFHHLKYNFHNDFWNHFSCCSFCLESVPSNIQKICSLTSFWGRCSLTIYLKLQFFIPPNIPYSLPCFIFLHCTYPYLTCNPLNLLIVLFFVLLIPQNVKAEICICSVYCYNLRHPGQCLIYCKYSVNTYQMHKWIIHTALQLSTNKPKLESECHPLLTR